MPATLIDSLLFGDVFSTAAMRGIWADENRVAQYLAFEAALARVQGRLGLIPAEAAEEIDRACRIERIDMARLRSQTERAGTPIVGLVSQINALCRDGFGEYCHWGATTQDVTDTATVLQIRASLEIVDAGLTAIATALAALAQKHRLTPMAGRTHLQQAVPVSFGYKMAGLLSAVQRHRERLAQLAPRVLQLEFAGAAGTLASLPRLALETQAALAAELGLAQPVIAWHTQRDTIAEVGAFLGLVGGTLGKLSMDVKLLMQTEVGEVFEPFAPGRGASSTMPQKRNPDAAELVRAKTGRVIGALTGLLIVMKGLPLAYQKDMQEDKQGAMEAFAALSLAIRAMTGMVLDLVPDEARMKAAAGEGYATATDLADWLVRTLKMPFRDAHHVTGRLVARAEACGVDLAGLTLADMQAEEPGITADIFGVLTVEASVASRTSYGGTAPANVAAQAARWQAALA